jgi:hypothetical protein
MHLCLFSPLCICFARDKQVPNQRLIVEFVQKIAHNAMTTQSALISTGLPGFTRLLHYCVVKVFTGLFTPSVVPRGSIESTV